MLAIVVLLALLATLTPASAAQATIVAGPSAALTYYTPLVVVQKGKTVNFTNLDTLKHDVWEGTPTAKTGKFKSAQISFFQTTAVAGVKVLPKGTYKFFCTLHHAMKGTLRII